MRPYREGNGLVTIMENHHYGWMPNFVSELAKEAFTEGGMDFETHVRAIAARDFRPAAADEVLAAWAAKLREIGYDRRLSLECGWAKQFDALIGPAVARLRPFREGK